MVRVEDEEVTVFTDAQFEQRLCHSMVAGEVSMAARIIEMLREVSGKSFAVGGDEEAKILRDMAGAVENRYYKPAEAKLEKYIKAERNGTALEDE